MAGSSSSRVVMVEYSCVGEVELSRVVIVEWRGVVLIEQS